jgi:hypothetical protein
VIIDLYFYKQKGGFVGVWDLTNWNKAGYKMLLVFLVEMAHALACVDSSLVSWRFLSIGNHCNFFPLETKGNYFHNLVVTIVSTFTHSATSFAIHFNIVTCKKYLALDI